MSEFPFSVFCESLKPVAVSASGDFSVPVTGITCDSRRIEPGMLFCAIRGAKADGHLFLDEAVKKGIAAAVISAGSGWTPPASLPVVRVNDSYYAWSLICETFYGLPAHGIDVYAVTGTNGKTTIAYLLRRIFRAAYPGEACGLLSTVEYDTGAGDCAESARTTPAAETFQQLFAQMKRNGCRRAVMELSSHGLHQHRTGSLRFAGAAFTNLTGDHLDYHGTMENYYQAKRILFTELLRPGAPAVLNADDGYCRRLRGELAGSGTDVHSVTLHGEPGADLAAVLALASCYFDFPIANDFAAIGEVGLAGELRGVSNLSLRLSEVRRLGFSSCMIPVLRHGSAPTTEGLEIIQVPDLPQALRRLFGRGKSKD